MSYSKYCRINKKLNELSLNDNTLNQLNNIFIENGDTSSDKFLEEKGLQINEIDSSS